MTLHERVMEKVDTVIPKRLTSKEIAFSGTLAAVMAVAAFIPVTVVAGVGKVISAAVMLEPLIGVLLGPLLGTYSAAAGAFVGQVVAPQGAIFGPLTFIPPTVGTATAALLAHKHWKAACGVMIGVLLLWWSTGIGRELYYYPYMPLIFLGLALLFRGHLGEWIHVKYDEIIGFRGAGTRVMIIGLSLVVVAQIFIFAVIRELVVLGIIFSAAAVLFVLAFTLTERTLFKNISAAAFLVGAVFIFFGMVNSSGLLLAVTVMLCLTFLFLALVMLGWKFSGNGFLFSCAVCGVVASIFMVKGLPAVEDDIFVQALLEKFSYILLILGVFLFSVFHFKNKIVLRKWSGITLFLAGFAGLIQRFLLLSFESQAIRREILRLDELIPFSTSIFGDEVDITSIFYYYVKKVIPVYVGHIGWFFIFLALIVLGVSFFLNISLEKLSVAYFVIAGFAVLSDLMIGNFLAIQVLELKAGIFKAFLFIYPVERMFMALFATIFGVGAFVPLKKYGFNQLIRR